MNCASPGEKAAGGRTAQENLGRNLGIKGEPYDSHREQRAKVSDIAGGREKRKQNADVDRMTNGAVGPGSNRLVAFFEGDSSSCRDASGPKGQNTSTGGQAGDHCLCEAEGRLAALGIRDRGDGQANGEKHARSRLEIRIFD